LTLVVSPSVVVRPVVVVVLVSLAEEVGPSVVVVGSTAVVGEESDSLPSVVPGEVVIVVGAEEAVIMVVTLVSPAEQEIAVVATVRRRNGVWRVACMMAVLGMVTRPPDFADGMRHIFRKRGRGKTLADA
jgi:hypothetical protein